MSFRRKISIGLSMAKILITEEVMKTNGRIFVVSAMFVLVMFFIPITNMAQTAKPIELTYGTQYAANHTFSLVD